MRAYFFNNMYLNGIHNGIQAGHALDQLWSSLSKATTVSGKKRFKMLKEFSEKHKTWIILRSGDHEALMDLCVFMTSQTTYPHNWFNEPGLNNSCTSVVVILPERMYDDTANAVGRALLKGDPLSQNGPALELDLKCADRKYTPWEREFLKRKAMCGLAS